MTDEDWRTAPRVAAGHLSTAHLRGSLGLAVLLVHAGGDGDYVLVHTWIERRFSLTSEAASLAMYWTATARSTSGSWHDVMTRSKARSGDRRRIRPGATHALLTLSRPSSEHAVRASGVPAG